MQQASSITCATPVVHTKQVTRAQQLQYNTAHAHIHVRQPWSLIIGKHASTSDAIQYLTSRHQCRRRNHYMPAAQFIANRTATSIIHTNAALIGMQASFHGTRGEQGASGCTRSKRTTEFMHTLRAALVIHTCSKQVAKHARHQ